MPVRDDFAPGEFCWIDLMAHDMEAAAAWYGEVFGWSHQLQQTPEGAPPYAFLTQGENVVGGIGQMHDEMKAQGIPPLWNSYVSTADCSATEAQVRELGGTVTVPTSEIPGFGKLAFFLDPEGASFAVWQDLAECGPGTLVADPVSMSWVELMTRDTSKAGAFYGKLFGWDFATMPMGDVDYVIVKHQGKDAGGMMPMGEGFEGVPANWLVYFGVADCDATASAVEKAKGTVRVPPTEIPVGKFAVLGDAQGGVFAIVSKTEGC